MSVLVSLAAVVVLFLVGFFVGPAGGVFFGVVLPYAAVAVFLVGLVYRVWGYAKVPVPFRITTTCGQQKSLPWIKHARLDCPSGKMGVVGRMILELACFRSLLRNTKTKLAEGGRVIYQTDLALWLGALAFHWCLVIVLLRHLRLVFNPVPSCLTFLQEADGFLEIGIPEFYVSSVVFLVALAYLLGRRLTNPQVRYISLLDDYFPLFLLLGIGLSGFWLRHVDKADIVGIKQLAAGLASFNFGNATEASATVAPLFYGHLFLVCVLLVYFPFSKLTHMAGAFLSPTRNLANNNRRVRHVNPWDYPVKTHPYNEYEDEWRDKMKAAGLPVEKE